MTTAPDYVSLKYILRWVPKRLLVRKPEKAQLIQPPITIIGSMFVRFPFIISVIIDGSVTGQFYV